MLSEIRHAFRALIQAPRFTFIAVLVLSIGIAGNVFVFTLVNGLFLKPLPFPAAERLVDIDETAPGWNLTYAGINYADFEAWRSQNTSFEAMATFRGSEFNLAAGPRRERLPGQYVTHDLADVYGIKPVVGRMFTPEEEFRGGPKVAVIGYHIWQDWFSSDPGVLGRTLTIDSDNYEIIGVLPATAVLPSRSAVWLPFPSKPRNWAGMGIGRLKSDVTIAQASADLLHIHRSRIPESKENEITSPLIQPLLNRYLGDTRGIAALVQCTVALLLLIAAANTAGLMLARTLARGTELAVRTALGASRWQIARQLLTECVLLAAAGAVIGTLIGHWSARVWFSALRPELPAWTEIGIDARVVLFACAAAVLCATISALAPARLTLRRVDLRSMMGASTSQSTASSDRLFPLRALVVGEVALALVLLLTAGYMARAYLRIGQIDPGFQPKGVLTYSLLLPEPKYRSSTTRLAFINQHLERLRGLPQVIAAAASTVLPFSQQHTGNFFEPEGGLLTASDAKVPAVLTRKSSPEYFETMGIKIVQGRSFADNDREGLVIVNETLARQFWPGRNPIGKLLRFRGSKNPWMEVVGVAHDVRHYGLEGEVRPGVYLQLKSAPEASVNIVIRTKGEPGALAPTARAMLAEQDPSLPLAGLATMEERIAASLFMRRTYSSMTATFSAIALAMAITGLYGLVAYVVSQRTREFGIRVALGARGHDVLRLVFAEAGRLAIIGLILGLIAGITTSMLLASMLAGVSPFDPLVLLVSVTTLAVLIVTACLSPALRATRVNPVDILRAE